MLPDKPGCYLYYDKVGTVIYVGKAKRLKRRVSSYFNRVHDSVKTNVLVSNIADMRYIVVGSEDDALHLENSLIKEYKPRYNILLKDDKSYPWICVTHELYPRVFLTRNVMPKGGRYYGPYASTAVVRTLLELLKELYPLRSCRWPITAESVEKRSVRVCLDYHIHNCLGCCEGRVSPEEYGEYIGQVKRILSGDTQAVSDYLVSEMQRLAAELRFEEAQELKRKYQLIERYRAKSVVVSASETDIDVYSYEPGDNFAYVNYMHVRHGSVVQCVTFEFRKKLDESPEQILSYAVAEAEVQFHNAARTVVVPFLPDCASESRSFVVPQRGDKRRLLEISLQNARQYKHDKVKNAEKLNPEQRVTRLLTRMQKDFRLTELPRHIECFDNSNIQGSDAVAACVVFKMAKPSKKDYRKYNIKTVVGPDDYASMKEVVRRRYQRAIVEETPLPDLIITDGGKGQMEVVREVIQDELHLDIPIAGLAKDGKHRTSELLFGFPPETIGMPIQSFMFKFFTQIQDEVHRFAITFHKDKRSKSQTKSELDTIKGIGEKTKVLLLRHFKSVKRIREAGFDELKEVIGEAKTKALLNGLK